MAATLAAGSADPVSQVTRMGSRAGNLFPTLGGPLRFSWISQFFDHVFYENSLTYWNENLSRDTDSSLSLFCAYLDGVCAEKRCVCANTLSTNHYQWFQLLSPGGTREREREMLISQNSAFCSCRRDPYDHTKNETLSGDVSNIFVDFFSNLQISAYRQGVPRLRFPLRGR